MGMFQPHNYGTDFLQGLTAVNGMFNDERRLKLEEQRQAEDAKTRSLQQEGLVLDNKKKSAEVERERKLGEFFDFTNRLQSGQLQDQDKARLAGVTEDLIKDTPYITEDVLQNPGGYKQKVKDLAEGVASIRTLPVGNYKYSRDDNVPEVNNMLDSYGSLLSKDRLGKTFTDSDGSVTGKAGAKYKTLAADGFMMASGEGNKAGFVPLFSVADESGNPIIGADGRRVLVPATMGTTNGGDDKLRVISPEELLTKAGYAAKVANVVETLGLNDPVKRQQYAAEGVKQYLSPDEQAKLVIAEGQKGKTMHAFSQDQDVYDGNGKLVRAGVPKDKYLTVHDGDTIIEASTGKTVAAGKPTVKAPTTRTIKDNGLELAQEWDQGTGTWKTVGKQRIKETADPYVAERERAKRESKAQIDVALKEYNSAKKSLDTAKKGTDLDALDSAQADFDAAKAAYTNRAKEHKQEFGKEYNPIKEVVERKDPRSVEPLISDFKKGRIESAKYVNSAISKGWTPDEIKRAARGTKSEEVINAYFATPPKQAPRQQAKKQSGNLSAAAKRIAEKY